MVFDLGELPRNSKTMVQETHPSCTTGLAIPRKVGFPTTWGLLHILHWHYTCHVQYHYTHNCIRFRKYFQTSITPWKNQYSTYGTVGKGTGLCGYPPKRSWVGISLHHFYWHFWCFLKTFFLVSLITRISLIS